MNKPFLPPLNLSLTEGVLSGKSILNLTGERVCISSYGSIPSHGQAYLEFKPLQSALTRAKGYPYLFIRKEEVFSNLPPYKPLVAILVSLPIALALKRKDLYALSSSPFCKPGCFDTLTQPTTLRDLFDEQTL